MKNVTTKNIMILTVLACNLLTHTIFFFFGKKKNHCDLKKKREANGKEQKTLVNTARVKPPRTQFPRIISTLLGGGAHLIYFRFRWLDRLKSFQYILEESI